MIVHIQKLGTEQCFTVCLCIDSLYQLLMELSSSSSSSSVMKPSSVSDSVSTAESQCLSAVACCCLLSLVISRGDTGKLLTAVAAMLMYSTRLAAQHIMVLYSPYT